MILPMFLCATLSMRPALLCWNKMELTYVLFYAYFLCFSFSFCTYIYSHVEKFRNGFGFVIFILIYTKNDLISTLIKYSIIHNIHSQKIRSRVSDFILIENKQVHIWKKKGTHIRSIDMCYLWGLWNVPNKQVIWLN